MMQELAKCVHDGLELDESHILQVCAHATAYPVYDAGMLYATRYLQYASFLIHGKASSEQVIIQPLNPIPTAVT